MDRSLSRLVFFTTCACFLSFGIYSAGLGPVLIELAERTGSTMAAVGVIFSAIYAGSLTTQFTSGWLTSKFGRLKVMTVSIFLMALGLLALVNIHSFFLLIMSCFVIGLGQGGLDMVSNLLVTEAYPDKSVAVLNILHLVYGVGSTLGPALVSLSIRFFNFGLLLEWFAGILFLILSIVFLFISRKSPKPPHRIKTLDLSKNEGTPVLKNVIVWLLGSMLLIVVGTQFSVGSWSSIFMTSTIGLDAEKASLIASFYWMFISIGRVIAVFLSKRLDQMSMLVFHMAGSLFGAICFVLSTGHYLPSVISLMVISVSFGGLYPLLLSLIPTFFSKNVDKACSIIVALGTVGGLIFPTFTGNILNTISPLAYSWTILIFIALLACLSILLRQKFLKEQAPQSIC